MKRLRRVRPEKKRLMTVETKTQKVYNSIIYTRVPGFVMMSGEGSAVCVGESDISSCSGGVYGDTARAPQLPP